MMGPLNRAIKALREGRVTSTQLVHRSIENLEKHSSDLNVLAYKNFDNVLAESASFDLGISRGILGGIPTLIKDLQNVQGMPTRKGSVALKNAAPEKQDDTTPMRLRMAGSVFVGKTTLPEFACNGFTANNLTGVTRNPWNLELSPGGSSGGSTAALSAGLTLIATGTDGGGSVRIPAGFCGLLGLKPTNGVLGRWPTPDWMDYSTDGIFAHSADDLQLLYNILKGPVAGDPTAPTIEAIRAMDQVRPKPKRIFAADRTSSFGPLPKELKKHFDEAVLAFGELMGVEVIWKDPKEFFTDGNPDLDWYTIVSAEGYGSLGEEWVKKNWDKLYPTTKEFLNTGKKVDINKYLENRRRRYSYTRVMDQLLGLDGLLLTPTNASLGWKADGSYEPQPKDYSVSIQNVTGNPAISIPFGICSNKLPFGLQVTAPHYQDNRLIQIASMFQEVYPWKQLAPGYRGFEGLI